ncbi:hypothetical protein CHUAL_003285 [Chamberlinius hualienensis]
MLLMEFLKTITVFHMILVSTNGINHAIRNFTSPPTPPKIYFEFKCHFNFAVDCVWIKNGNNNTGKVINIKPYKFVAGSVNTTDCTIRADDSTEVRLFNKKNPYLNCSGITAVKKTHVEAGASVSLQCSAPTKVGCCWKRNSKSVYIGGRYRYDVQNIAQNNFTDCSVTIENVNPTYDEGFWECCRKATDKDSPTDSYSLSLHYVTTQNESVLTKSSMKS